ncbi:oleoyl-acyl carrier protein thioesterase 2, chloroplastic-like [Chenopodium quinoa]|uniref:oleoyl-acyl carrier protein thioesterase 2, chloroplastic-like n=1 Tax=Chenopodium quinoa TaxID=63459 RepID=UPI000B777088|nr:oleoyl-acyl carrier protein thioesterase 2, chloroplastic-like [Chenopodium quinoa]
MRKLHLIWVTTCMHIEIYRYPAWSDVVEIETWWQAEGKIGTRCDFILKDYANGEVIGRASSKWVMLNMDTRRLERVTPQIGEDYLIYCPKELRDQHIMGIQNARSAKIHLSVHRALDGRYVAVWIPPEDAARFIEANTNFDLGTGVLIAVPIPTQISISELVS